MDLPTLKVFMAGVLFVVAMAGVLAARHLAAISQRWVQLGNAFAGGVLIAIALVHVLSETAGTLEPWGRKLNEALGGGCEEKPCADEGIEPFPVGLALAGAGFFLMVTLGQVLGSHEHEEGHGHGEAGGPNEAPASSCELGEAGPREAAADRSVGTGAPEAGRADEAKQLAGRGGAGVAAFGTLVGLSVHATIEGVATGSAATAEQLLLIAGAIVVHKGFAAFAVGTSLAGLHQTSPSTWWLLGALFSVTGSCGMVVGMLLGRALEGPASAALQCVASGTLLAVGIDDMLMPALKGDAWRKRKILAAVVAYSSVSLLAAWA